MAGLLTVFFATAGLYLVLVKELDRSTDLFLADKVNVLQTMLRDRPESEVKRDIEAARQTLRNRLLAEGHVQEKTSSGR